MALRVHHLNCGTLRALGGPLVDEGYGLGRACLCCHCLLIETARAGLVLVDTGIGTRDVADPNRFSWSFRFIGGPTLRRQEAAVNQVRTLGHHPDDVRHVVMTHLDLDHAGGLSDFPEATVHLHEAELDAALARRGLNAHLRYVPAQWSHQPQWQAHADGGDTWRQLSGIRVLHEIDPDVALVPLPGHTPGHCGVLVRVDGGWKLHAGDSYYHRDQLRRRQRCPLGLHAFQVLMQSGRAARLENLRRVRGLALDSTDDLEVFSAHDFREYERCAASS